jgi:hypothetical protein
LEQQVADRASIAFAVALAALFAWSLFQAQGFRAQARLFPMVIAGVGLALALLQIGIELRRRRVLSSSQSDSASVQEMATDVHPSAPAPGEGEIPPDVQRRRTSIMLAWIGGFTLAVWLLGFPIAVPIATFAYLKLGAGESWPLSAAFAVVFGASFWALFVHFVRVPFDDGVLLSLWPV